MSGARILIFARAPVAGRAKTRLIPALGAEGAARLAADMLARTVAEALAAGAGPVELCVAPDPHHACWRGRLPADVTVSGQGEGGLGERLARAAAHGLASGGPVLLIGTDCPELDRRRLARAARRLDDHDAVVHPAEDGGYVLLGLSRFHPTLFEGIAWSMATVAAATIARIDALGWRLHVGEALRDVDVPADLAALAKAAIALPPPTPGR